MTERDLPTAAEIAHLAERPAPDFLPEGLAATAVAYPATGRRSEYVAGRYCAGRALAGLPGGSFRWLGRDMARAPAWPESAVGSITHTDGYALAVAARAASFVSLGVDSEALPSLAVVRETEALVLTPRERAAPAALGPREDFALRFSAKESFYKCIHPRLRRYVDFLEAEVFGIDHEARTFRIALMSGLTLDGRFALDAARVHTLVTWPRAAAVVRDLRPRAAASAESSLASDP